MGMQVCPPFLRQCVTTKMWIMQKRLSFWNRVNHSLSITVSIAHLCHSHRVYLLWTVITQFLWEFWSIFKEDEACSACGELRNTFKILLGKPEGKKQLRRLRRRWEILWNWILRKCSSGLGSLKSWQGSIASPSGHAYEPSDSKRRGILWLASRGLCCKELLTDYFIVVRNTIFCCVSLRVFVRCIYLFPLYVRTQPCNTTVFWVKDILNMRTSLLLLSVKILKY